MSAVPIRWLQPLPRGDVVERERALVEAAREKRVIHVGFVDEGLLDSRLADGTWLHEHLSEVAESIVGLDCSAEGVQRARRAGHEAYVVDVQAVEAVQELSLAPAGVVIAGEVIEHLDAPGPFLRAMRSLVRPDGLLVVTTPNAYRPLNSLVALSGAELIHPDHTAWHSPHTLRVLLERNGWRVVRNALDHAHESGLRRRLAIHAANGVRRLAGLVARRRPYWSDGLIVWARPEAGP